MEYLNKKKNTTRDYVNGKTLLEVSERSIFNDFAELTLSLKALFAAFSQTVSIFSRKSNPKWRFYVIKVLCDIISHSVAVATAYKASAYQAVVLSCITVKVPQIETGLAALVYFSNTELKRTWCALMCGWHHSTKWTIWTHILFPPLALNISPLCLKWQMCEEANRRSCAKGFTIIFSQTKHWPVVAGHLTIWINYFSWIVV